jgi:hypothetical protein
MSENGNGEDAVQRRGEAARPPEADRQQPERTRFPTRQEFDQLVQQANDGNRRAQARLRAILDDCPEIWQRAGNLAEHAELSLVRLIAKEEWLLTESVRRCAAQMRSELAGPDPTPLEAIAVERVVACWLQLQYVDGLCAQADGELGRASFWLKRQTQANRQFHAALKSLCMIRTLLPPSSQPLPRLPATNDARPLEGSAPGSGGPGSGPGLDGAELVPAYPAEHGSERNSNRRNGHTNRIAALA